MHSVKHLLSERFFTSVTLLASSVTVTACGIPVGGGVPNDAKPTGTIVATGTISGSGGGKTSSGNATVYANGASYILRLDSLSVANEAGLQVILDMQSGPPALTASLRAPSGNQNYNVAGIVGTFVKVEIYSTSTQTDYATATLVYPGP